MKNRKTSIKITKHADYRLKQRVGIKDENTWQQFVKNARYKGDTINTMSEKHYEYCKKHGLIAKLNNSTQIRYYKGFFFVFKGNNGHMRTLVTVIKYKEKVVRDLVEVKIKLVTIQDLYEFVATCRNIGYAIQAIQDDYYVVASDPIQVMGISLYGAFKIEVNSEDKELFKKWEIVQ